MNDIIIVIMILIFECDRDFPRFHLQTLLLHYRGRQTIKDFIPCKSEHFKTSASFILQYKIKTCWVCYIFYDNLQGTQIDSDRLRIKSCLYMCTKQPLLHRQRLHVRNKNDINRNNK